MARASGAIVVAALALGAGAVLRAESAPGGGASGASARAASGGGFAVARALTVSMPDAIRETDEPVPADVRVELAPERAGTRVTLRRDGHVVALRSGATRATGQDWVAVVMRADPDDLGVAQLVWETTDPATLATARGLLSLRPGAAEPPRVAMAPMPETVAEHRKGKHACRAHRDGAGGFTVLCKIERGARAVSVANVLGARALEDVWKSEGGAAAKETVSRLDLPLSPGDARAAVLGYTNVLTGVVVRAEATWIHGETRPSLSLGSLERKQPVAAF